jgi:type I restriction enzyme S subunit
VTGVVNDDWAYAPLNDIARPDAPIGYGIVQPGSYVRDGVPVLAIRDLSNPSARTAHRSSSLVEAAYRRSRVLGGDILISVKGTTGRVGVVPAGFEGNISRDVARIRLRADHEPAYWVQLLQSEVAQQTLQQAAVGSTRQELSIGTLKMLRFRFPSRAEQERIAAVLADADQLASSLESLITKKQAIKLGMMQQLLTGHTRLPGFSSGWDEVELGDSGEVAGGGVDKKVNPGERAVRLLNYMDVYRAEFIDASTAIQVVTAPTAKITKCTIRAGDVFFTPTSETPDDIARSAVAEADVSGAVYSYHLVRWRPMGEWDTTYLGFAFTTAAIRSQVSTLAAGSGTRYVVNLPGFRSLKVLRPAVAEQRAIGAALRAASDDIRLLQARLAKARAVKTGMMQQLLTGRARLFVPETAA